MLCFVAFPTLPCTCTFGKLSDHVRAQLNAIASSVWPYGIPPPDCLTIRLFDTLTTPNNSSASAYSGYDEAGGWHVP